MNEKQIEKFIECVCLQLKEQIENSGLQNIKEYYDLLKDMPDKIKEQAKNSSHILENATPLTLLSAINFHKNYLDHISALMIVFRQCNFVQKTNIANAHLTPQELDQLARQLTIAPGLLVAFQCVMEQKK